MIKNIFLLSYLYVVIITVITLGYSFFYNNIVVDLKITLVLLMALFPFFDMIFSSIHNNNTLSKDEENTIITTKSILFIIASIIILSFTNTLALALLLGLMIANIIFAFDTRYIFLGALAYIVLTGFFVILGDKVYSELFSIHAYYLLIFGVVKEIYLSITNSNTKNTNTDEEKSSESKEEVQSFIQNTFQNIVQKYTSIKNTILTDIGEKPDDSEHINSSETYNNLSNNLNNNNYTDNQNKKQSGLYVKLYYYTLSKIQLHIQNIVLSLFVISVTVSILNLYIHLYYLIIIVFALFFGTYIYSKSKSTDYNWIEYSKQYNIHTYSLHVLVIFASLGALGGYILHNYFGIQNGISSQTYIFFFALFSLGYSALSGGLIYKFFSLFANSDEKEVSSSYSLQTVLLGLWQWIKNHILLLIMSIALIILAGFIVVQSGLWGNIQKWQQERKGYENFRVIEESPSENDEFDFNDFDEFGQNNEDSFGNNENEEITESKNIGEIYTFTRRLELGTVSDQVGWLEDVLKRLGYFKGDIDEVFDETTRQSLIAVLQNECGWPETTTGAFGTQAQNCLYSLNMDVPVDNNTNNQENNDNNSQ